MLSEPTKLMATVKKDILCAQKFRKAPKELKKILPIIFDHYISGKKTFMLSKNPRIPEKILKIIKKFPQSLVK
jgi:hypothetical protein